MHWNTCESPHSSTGFDNTLFRVQIQQGSHAVSSPTTLRERGALRSRLLWPRECWMTHRDQICSLKNTLLAHDGMKFFHQESDSNTNGFKKLREACSGKWLRQARLQTFCECFGQACSFCSTEYQLLWFPLRQINIPSSYICQYFYPFHVLEHLRYAETWWCRQIHHSCKHL